MRPSLAWYRENETMSSENEDSSLVSIANETRISRPVQLESFPVSWSDWDFIRSLIKRCQVKIDIWGMLTSFFFSAAIFALSVALTSGDSISEMLRVLYFVIAVAALVLTLVCLFARLTSGYAQHERIQAVLENMNQIERRYQRPTAGPPTPSDN
jgi:ABC-type multidrug transport system fused ATPase/permease subunit